MAVHRNYVSKSGQVYCKKENAILFADSTPCKSCPMFAGFLQGRGVECSWVDRQNKIPVVEVYNPREEYSRLNNK